MKQLPGPAHHARRHLCQGLSDTYKSYRYNPRHGKVIKVRTTLGTLNT